MVERMRFLNREGFATFAIDFQAHGMSQGRFITLGARESFDARAAVQWLRERLPGEKIGVIAISLGGAAALIGDEPMRVEALALESVYPDIFRATRNRFRFFLGPLGEPFTRAALLCGEIALGVKPESMRPARRDRQNLGAGVHPRRRPRSLDPDRRNPRIFRPRRRAQEPLGSERRRSRRLIRFCAAGISTAHDRLLERRTRRLRPKVRIVMDRERERQPSASRASANSPSMSRQRSSAAAISSSAASTFCP